jgi:hypothetical protein
MPFAAYISGGPSGVLRGYMKPWLGLVFAQYDAAELNAAGS